MKNIIFQGVTPEQLNELIQEGIREQFEGLKNQEKPQHPKDLLTKKETRELLSISTPTLDKKTKAGVLISYRFGGRIYYKLDEVISSLTKREFK